ncbi:hypothetical protein NLJ89_g8852 [Agrocybe chaxingu]|uniref:Uncharacterized protein n=1 Tax=Agrocybe chaxingu TaxID=84603 RepID=A0A9W8JUI8_9AGAR|nr:hypothetical protein NLJ89_g8852 [Agrocybe chaxingu]
MVSSFICKHLDVHCRVRRSRANSTVVIASSARRSHPHAVVHASNLTLRFQGKPIKRQEDGDGSSRATTTDDSDNDANPGNAKANGRPASTVTQDLLTFISIAAPEQTASLRTSPNATNTISFSTPLPEPSSLPSPTNLAAGFANAGCGTALAECQQASPQSARYQLGSLRLALPVGTIAAIIMIAMFCITLGMVIYVTQKGKSWQRFRERQLKHESQLLAFSFGGGARDRRPGSGGFERGRRASRSRSGDEGRTTEYVLGAGGDEKPEDKALVERSTSLKSFKSLFLPGLRLDRSLLDLQNFEESGPSTPLDAQNFQLGSSRPREDSPTQSPEEVVDADYGADANWVSAGMVDRPSSSSSATSTAPAPTVHSPNMDASHPPP